MRIQFILLSFFLSNTVFSDPYVLLDKSIRKEVKKGELIGVAVAVVDRGKVAFIKTYGVRKKGEKGPIDVNTVFQLGSISKPITVSLVAALQKRKIFDFNAPHVQQVLSHTTGYKRTGWNSRIEAGWSRSKLIQALSESEHGKPGESYDYHNVAFSQIEDLITAATHIPFDRTMKQYLFEPIGMTRTKAGFTDFSQQENRAWPHESVKQKYRVSRAYSRAYHDVVTSAGGVNSSINDMAKFLQLQLGQFPAVATQTELAQFYVDVSPAPDAIPWFKNIKYHDLKSYYGYGWRIINIDGERIVFHGGWLKGFMNFLAFSPKRQIGIVILSNTESDFAMKTAVDFLRENSVKTSL